MAQKITITARGDKLSVHDGYHSIDELYDHRCLLMIALCHQLRDLSYVQTESDEFFILGLKLPIEPKGQISYHIPIKYLPLVATLPLKAVEFDGHTSTDVLRRLETFAIDDGQDYLESQRSKMK